MQSPTRCRGSSSDHFTQSLLHAPSPFHWLFAKNKTPNFAPPVTFGPCFIQAHPGVPSQITGFDLIHGDVLSLNMEETLAKVLDGEEPGTQVKVVANLPYYITTDVLKKLLPLGGQISNLIFMLQVCASAVTSPPARHAAADHYTLTGFHVGSYACPRLWPSMQWSFICLGRVLAFPVAPASPRPYKISVPLPAVRSADRRARKSQEEVAQRFAVHQPGNRDYRFMSVFCRFYSK